MAHMSGIDRTQMLLLPERVEDYVGANNTVRFIDAFVEVLDLQKAGFARVDAEATGCPVIATPVSGLREQVRHEETGLITGDVSSDAIAQAVSLFLNNPDLLQSCAENAFQCTKTELSWKHVGGNFADAVHKLATASSESALILQAQVTFRLKTRLAYHQENQIALTGIANALWIIFRYLNAVTGFYFNQITFPVIHNAGTFLDMIDLLGFIQSMQLCGNSARHPTSRQG